jgi:hypothetical protein
VNNLDLTHLFSRLTCFLVAVLKQHVEVCRTAEQAQCRQHNANLLSTHQHKLTADCMQCTSSTPPAVEVAAADAAAAGAAEAAATPHLSWLRSLQQNLLLLLQVQQLHHKQEPSTQPCLHTAAAIHALQQQPC